MGRKKPKPSLSNDDELVYWSDVRGNIFSAQLDPRMLLPEGFIKPRATSRIGSQASYGESFLKVHYDRNFVIGKLARFINQLNPKDLETFQQIVKEAWERRNDELRTGEEV